MIFLLQRVFTAIKTSKISTCLICAVVLFFTIRRRFFDFLCSPLVFLLTSRAECRRILVSNKANNFNVLCMFALCGIFTTRKTCRAKWLCCQINAGPTTRWCDNPSHHRGNIPAKPHNTSLMFPFFVQHWKNIWSTTTAGIYYGWNITCPVYY